MDLFEAAEAKKTTPAPEVLTVSAITALIKRSLEERFTEVWVVGQISNLTRAASGHVYLTLKDEAAEIGAVIWRGPAQRIPFQLEDGQEVVVRGKVAVYERRGRYQIIVSSVQPKGIGALQLAFLQMKEKLEKEGLFDPAHKRPLPFLPATIAVVTSPTGAAIHDILTMIESRLPGVHVLVCPVAVQGERAALEIAAAISALNRRGGIDVMIVGRGGGSLEDLWSFNEEIVARAIYASDIPVISAVGHEVDVSISDLVADARALTPTQAGEMVVPSRKLLDERLAAAANRLAQALRAAAAGAKVRLDAIAASYAMRLPMERVRQHQQRLDEVAERMPLATGRELARRRERIARDTERLEGLSPLNVLARGYSITTLAGSDKPLRSADEAPGGSRIRTILHDGELESRL
ncbi:MAG: exodeoxyribonuclease VII large subunit [Planctomycetota bacterium]